MGVVGSLPLEDLTDVEITQPPRNGQTLIFDEAEGVWRNRAGGGTGGGTGGGAEYLSDLSDVQTTRPADGQVLTYNGTRWVNGGIVAGDNVTVATSGGTTTISAQVPPQQNITIDAALDSTSQNPVRNSTVTLAINGINATVAAHGVDIVDNETAIAALDGRVAGASSQIASLNQALAGKADTASLAAVAFSGKYADLSGAPTIPAEYVLPIAGADRLGGIRIGTGLSIDGNGTVSVSGGGGTGGGGSVTVDTALDINSTNPIENRAVSAAFEYLDELASTATINIGLAQEAISALTARIEALESLLADHADTVLALTDGNGTTVYKTVLAKSRNT